MYDIEDTKNGILPQARTHRRERSVAIHKMITEKRQFEPLASEMAGAVLGFQNDALLDETETGWTQKI